MVAAAIDTYLALPRGRPGALPLRRPPAGRSTARPTATRSAACPTSSASRRPRSSASRCERAGRDPRAAAPWGHGVVGHGPLGRRLVAARRAPHAPLRARRTPDRSRLGRTVRRRDRTRAPEGGQVTNSLPASVDPKALQEVLDGRWAHVRRDARENLDDPDFLPVYGEIDAGGPRAGDPRGARSWPTPAASASASPRSTAARTTPAARSPRSRCWPSATCR